MTFVFVCLSIHLSVCLSACSHLSALVCLRETKNLINELMMCSPEFCLGWNLEAMADYLHMRSV